VPTIFPSAAAPATSEPDNSFCRTRHQGFYRPSWSPWIRVNRATKYG